MSGYPGAESARGGAPPGRLLRAVPVPRGAHGTLDDPIETKFTAPSARAEWVERSDLMHRLDGAAAARLVLLDAPAGFGKTTLVAQWRAAAIGRQPFAWVSLDDGDNYPGRLWWHVAHALWRACPGLGAEFLRDLRCQFHDITGALLPALVNKLVGLPARVALVLDDYHALTEPSCHEQLTFFLLHLPASVQVVIMARAEPPLPIARLRAAGDLAEIGPPQLCFTAAEAAWLVLAVSGVELSGPDLATLVERTEGWPTGLYLAALLLRGCPSATAFVRQFSGENRFVVDFMTEEVLGGQPATIRQFLRRTSILGRFSAPLCEAVAGWPGAAEALAFLEQHNLFVVPLDSNRHWFRYHHLFGQVLRNELASAEPDLVPVLHQRASSWHQRQGSVDEAIRHAIAGGALTEAVGLIARHWPAYVDSGQLAAVRGWMRMLGDDAIRADPLAAHCAAWAAALAGDQEAVRRWIPVMAAARRGGPLPDGMRSLRSSIALLRGVYGFEGLRAMHAAANTAVELERDPASPWYALAMSALGFARYLSGEPKAARDPLEQAVSSAPAIAMVRLQCLSALALTETELGRLPRALELARAARGLVDGGNLCQTPQAAFAYTAAGAANAAIGRLQEARLELEHALRSRRKAPGISPWGTAEAMLTLTQALLDLGDRPAAAALAGQTRQLLSSSPDAGEAQLIRLVSLERRLAGRSRSVALADPLTEREIAVLRLLQSPLSLREIARELHLSANTVKTHTQGVYRKLGVSTRHDATARGREAGLL